MKYGSDVYLKMICERIKEYRIDYPLTQQQLADKSGVSLHSIQNIEKGSDMQFTNLIKVLSALDLEENINLLVPDMSQRPSAFVEHTKKRQRVRVKKQTNSAFVWGDDK